MRCYIPISGRGNCLAYYLLSAESLPVLNEENLLYAYRPTVRHHIAHFCPNLDVARQCIRKCMQLGLPSFCGKDHVCYCGHKYKNTDMNPKTNAEEVYNQFKDLYTKYFGPDTRSKKPQDHIDE
ncbi:unnamed protein product [Leptosia nina]|uniref:Uncharacterized protein n=1 Tax=Leptosia nina TaxID=320188 RepID=A0AAV1IW16_9NEOP